MCFIFWLRHKNERRETKSRRRKKNQQQQQKYKKKMLYTIKHSRYIIGQL